MAIEQKTEETALAQRPPTIEGMIQTALDRNVPVETMERLLAMFERVKAQQAKEAYYEALSAFQSECPAIEKKRSVYNKDGSTVRYRYAALEDIVDVVRPILRRHGLSYSHNAEFEANPAAQVVTCTIKHAAGHSETTTFRSPIQSGYGTTQVQDTGSAITYARRYTLLNALGIVVRDEDNDGQARESRQEVRPRAEGLSVHQQAQEAQRRAEPFQDAEATRARSAGSPAPAREADKPPSTAGQPIARGKTISLRKPEQKDQGLTHVGDVMPSRDEFAGIGGEELLVLQEMRGKLREMVFQYWHLLTRGAGDAKPNDLQTTAFLNGASKKRFKGKSLDDLDMGELDQLYRQVDEFVLGKVGS